MRKEKGLKPYILAALITNLLLVGIVLFAFLDLFCDYGNAREIDIPHYKGVSEAEILNIDGVSYKKNYVFSDTVKKGIVISQSQHGRVKAGSGDVVYVKLDISLGRETHALPDLAGLDLYEASGIIREMGCVVKTVFSESDKEQDKVLFTLPKAQTELYAGDVVTLYVATRSAPKTVRVPDFYGCGLDSLESQVKDAGLTVGKIEFIYSEDFLPNTVVYQSVGKNCLVKTGEAVDFYICRAPRN